MQDGSSFFGSGGGLIARPPKRVTPASRGANNAHHFKQQASYLSRVAAGTYIVPTVGGGITLYSASTGSTIATLDPNASVISATGMNAGTNVWLRESLIYDWVAGFWYCLVKDSTRVLLVKINDTTGSMTLPGSPFTPATIANWVSNGYGYLSGTTLKFICNAGGSQYGPMVVHTVNLVGTLAAQDQSFVLSDGTTVPVLFQPPHYITADGSAAIFFQPLSGYGGASPQQMAVSFAKGGVVIASPANFAMVSDGVSIDARVLYDGESVTVGQPQAGQVQYRWKHYDRTDFDRWVKAIIKAAAGV